MEGNYKNVQGNGQQNKATKDVDMDVRIVGSIAQGGKAAALERNRACGPSGVFQIQTNGGGVFGS